MVVFLTKPHLLPYSEISEFSYYHSSTRDNLFIHYSDWSENHSKASSLGNPHQGFIRVFTKFQTNYFFNLSGRRRIMNDRVIKSVFLVPLVVSIALILFPGMLMADTCCVRIEGTMQGEITQGLRCDGREDVETALSTIVNSRIEKFKPFKFEKHSNRISPLLQMAMFNDEPLQLVFRYYQVDPTGAEENYYSIRLTGAKVVGVKGSLVGEVTPQPVPPTEKVALIYGQISWIHELSGVQYDSCTVLWTQDKKGAWTGVCAP
jgi:type VI secretion system Hcp family effector